MIRAKTYSVESSPETRGSLSIAVKIYPGGWVSGYLAGLAVGDSAWMARTQTRDMLPPTEVS